MTTNSALAFSGLEVMETTSVLAVRRRLSEGLGRRRRRGANRSTTRGAEPRGGARSRWSRRLTRSVSEVARASPSRGRRAPRRPTTPGYRDPPESARVPSRGASSGRPSARGDVRWRGDGLGAQWTWDLRGPRRWPGPSSGGSCPGAPSRGRFESRGAPRRSGCRLGWWAHGPPRRRSREGGRATSPLSSRRRSSNPWGPSSNSRGRSRRSWSPRSWSSWSQSSSGSPQAASRALGADWATT